MYVFESQIIYKFKIQNATVWFAFFFFIIGRERHNFNDTVLYADSCKSTSLGVIEQAWDGPCHLNKKHAYTICCAKAPGDVKLIIIISKKVRPIF